MSTLRVAKKALLIIVFSILAALLFWSGKTQFYKFFNEFFILPLGRSYNQVNSVVYALLLFGAIFFLSRILPLLKIEVDGKFCLVIIPFILLGSCLRVFQDAGIYNSVFLFSPLIYLLIFVYTFICLLFSLKIAQKVDLDYHFALFFFGAVPAVISVFQLVLRIVNVSSVVLTFVLGLVSCLIGFVVFLGLHRLLRFYNFALDLGVVSSHLLDVSATFVGVTFYGYGEQHFMVRLISEVFGSVLFFYLLDFLVIVLAVLVLERILREEQALLGLLG